MFYARGSDGQPKKVKDIKIRGSDAALKSIKFVKVRGPAGVFATVWQRLGIAMASSVEGYANSNSTIAITTSAPNPVISGGTEPYTYSWTGSAGWTILYPTQRNTSFRKAAASGESFFGSFTLTVTDSTGATAQSSVTAYVENYGGFA